MIVRSLGYSRVIVFPAAPDAASSERAFARFRLIAALLGSDPRNMLGITPGAWIEPGPASRASEP